MIGRAFWKTRPREYPVGLGIIALFAALALLGVFYTPWDPFAMDAAQKFAPPSPAHPFGTDNFGRDILSRAITGLRYSLVFSVAALGLSFFCGVTLGLLAAGTNKTVDMVIMHLVDAVNSIPVALFSLALLAAFRGVGWSSHIALIIALGIVFIPAFVRVTRNEAMRIRELGYIDHAKVLGTGDFRIMYAHILPNLYGPLSSTAIIVIVNSMTVESILSYLGLGIQPPLPSLGRMLFDAQSCLFNAPWAAVFPGLTLALLLAGFNLLGEGLRKGW
jgi:peptide/nickel transport system permease protein